MWLVLVLLILVSCGLVGLVFVSVLFNRLEFDIE